MFDALQFNFESDNNKYLIFLAAYFGVEVLAMLVTSVFCWLLFQNFKFEVGDKIESYLMQVFIKVLLMVSMICCGDR